LKISRWVSVPIASNAIRKDLCAATAILEQPSTHRCLTSLGNTSRAFGTQPCRWTPGQNANLLFEPSQVTRRYFDLSAEQARMVFKSGYGRMNLSNSFEAGFRSS